jgi:hypothetical protein
MAQKNKKKHKHKNHSKNHSFRANSKKTLYSSKSFATSTDIDKIALEVFGGNLYQCGIIDIS